MLVLLSLDPKFVVAWELQPIPSYQHHASSTSPGGIAPRWEFRIDVLENGEVAERFAIAAKQHWSCECLEFSGLI